MPDRMKPALQQGTCDWCDRRLGVRSYSDEAATTICDECSAAAKTTWDEMTFEEQLEVLHEAMPT